MTFHRFSQFNTCDTTFCIAVPKADLLTALGYDATFIFGRELDSVWPIAIFVIFSRVETFSAQIIAICSAWVFMMYYFFVGRLGSRQTITVGICLCNGYVCDFSNYL